MKAPRLLKMPIVWVILVFLIVAFAADMLSSANGYKVEPTSKVVATIMADTPLREVVLLDGEQEIRVELKDTPSTKMRADWVGTQSEDLVRRLNERVAAGTLDSWRGESPDNGFWSMFLLGVFPFLLLGGLLFFMMNNAQGGGNRILGFGPISD